jgi:hypothetical protein
MLEAILNFCTFNALNTPREVYFGLAMAWLLLLGAGIASVISRKGQLWLKLVWMLVLVGLPVVGLFVYCLVCVLTADYSFLKLFGLHRQAASYLRNPSPRRSTEP